MLTSQKIISEEQALFPRLDSLYATAFPWHEQREPQSRRAAMADAHYVLEAWFDGEQFVGLSGCWIFDGYLYVEHLAVDGTLRSQGYGKRLLAQILQRQPVTVLEIDPLTTDVARRRLRFYESMGFIANPWPHVHPAYHAETAGHELIVLSYPAALEARAYHRFNDDLCRTVMKDTPGQERGADT